MNKLIVTLVSVLLCACTSHQGAARYNPNDRYSGLSEEQRETLEHIRETWVVEGARPKAPAPVAADEFQDVHTGLIWKRCLIGYEWNGSACSGKPIASGWMAFVNLTNDAGKREGKLWRMPTVRELQTVSFPQLPYENPRIFVYGVWTSDRATGELLLRMNAVQVDKDQRIVRASDMGVPRVGWLVRSQ